MSLIIEMNIDRLSQIATLVKRFKDSTDLFFVVEWIFQLQYKARHAHKRLYTVLPKYSKIQVLADITSCRLMKYNKQAIELNSLLINNMPKDGYGWS